MAKRRRRFHNRVYLRILRAQKMLCGACGEKLRRPIDFDHIKPLWLDGEDTPENLEALHQHCHREKTRREASDRAKMNRIIRKREGTWRPNRQKLRGRNTLGSSRYKRKLDGTVVRRDE